MERISYAACEETIRESGTDIVQYQNKNYKINFYQPSKEKVKNIMSVGQKIAKIKIKGEAITIMGFEE
jgi:hypothetical protein